MYKVHTKYVTIGFCDIGVLLAMSSVVRSPDIRIFEILNLMFFSKNIFTLLPWILSFYFVHLMTVE
jgi:hypothetical protein